MIERRRILKYKIRHGCNNLRYATSGSVEGEGNPRCASHPPEEKEKTVVTRIDWPRAQSHTTRTRRGKGNKGLNSKRPRRKKKEEKQNAERRNKHKEKSHTSCGVGVRKKQEPTTADTQHKGGETQPKVRERIKGGATIKAGDRDERVYFNISTYNTGKRSEQITNEMIIRSCHGDLKGQRRACQDNA